MTQTSENWGVYLDAARRKIQIAVFHRDCLEGALTSVGRTGALMPPIPIQAHFEGVLFSIMAAVDQVAQATNKALGMRLPPGELISKAFSALGEKLPAVQAWFNDKIGRDLRIIRTRAMHYSYDKKSEQVRWEVESTGETRDYAGDRDLLSYATAGVEYGQRLAALLDTIAKNLSEGNVATTG